MTLRGFPLTQAGHYRRLKARRFASQWNINVVPRVLSSPYAHSGYSWLNVSTRSPNISVLETRAFLNWPLLSSSLSVCTRCPALFLFVQREQRYRTREKESFLRIFAYMDRSRWKRTDEHRFSAAGFRLRFETLDLGYTSDTTYLHNDRPREASKPEAR